MKYLLIGLLLLSSTVYSYEEDWYLNVGFGFTNFGLQIQSEDVGDCEAPADCTDIQFNLGFYIPVEEIPLILGLDLDLQQRFASISGGASGNMGMTAILISSQYYFASDVVDGPYVGLELGMGSYSESLNYDGEEVYSLSGEMGPAFGISFGYALALGEETRFVPEVYYSSRSSTVKGGDGYQEFSADVTGNLFGITGSFLF